jgi:uncharacterized protein (DUF302 family)
MIIRNGVFASVLAALLSSLTQPAFAADTGLITKPSKYSVPETIERFKAAIKARGWIVFTELDHAAAAVKAGLQLGPRTVVVFGNPKLGTVPMQMAPTLAIENPPKALVWQDDQGKVWLTYNSAEYIASYVYPRHGLSLPPEGLKNYEQFLVEISDQATK